jgi:hypothetical protein
MADPGYGPNGERIDGVGRIQFEANAPPRLVEDEFEQWHIRGLGLTSVPFVSQTDEEVYNRIYPGGA